MLAPGVHAHSVVELVDLFPTLAELAHVAPPTPTLEQHARRKDAARKAQYPKLHSRQQLDRARSEDDARSGEVLLRSREQRRLTRLERSSSSSSSSSSDGGDGGRAAAAALARAYAAQSAMPFEGLPSEDAEDDERGGGGSGSGASPGAATLPGSRLPPRPLIAGSTVKDRGLYAPLPDGLDGQSLAGLVLGDPQTQSSSHSDDGATGRRRHAGAPQRGDGNLSAVPALSAHHSERRLLGVRAKHVAIAQWFGLPPHPHSPLRTCATYTVCV
jgi:hypothetical protein